VELLVTQLLPLKIVHAIAYEVMAYVTTQCLIFIVASLIMYSCIV